jgi:PHP family Zn ribbon phosphoesterase
MIPPLIVAGALEKNINLIAITDHNASANVAAVQNAAKESGLAILPGMELQTKEEVHLLCLFDNLEQLDSFQEIVTECLPDIENDAEHFGEQFVVDETGEFIRRENRLLLTSATLSFDMAVAKVNEIGGLAIPAHVDRPAFGLIANLGFVPRGISIDAIEVSRHMHIDQVKRKLPQVKEYPLVQDGDVHRLEEFLGANVLRMKEVSIAELRKALQGKENRSLTYRTEY